MYAIVLILNANAANDLILTYTIREDRPCLPGMLYRVSVKSHQESALVLRITHKAPENYKLKALGEPLDDKPVLSRRALAQARWLARHYVCSLNRAVSLFLPPPVRIKSEYRYYVAEQLLIEYKKNKEVQEQVLFPTPLQKQLWQGLLKAGRRGMSASRIKARWQDEALLQAEKWVLSGRLLRQQSWSQGHRGSVKDAMENSLQTHSHQCLEPSQELALERIKKDLTKGQFGHHLLFGVTGSGKTEVYFQAAANAIAQGRQVIYLVPEISLVPQIVAKALEWFGQEAAVMHSNLTAAQRYTQWQRIRSGEARLIIGPRSALFAPMQNLGLIILDEEHEHTYKQAEPEPRYDARDSAEHLARLWRAVLVRGSATPDLGTFYRAQKGEISLSALPKRIDNRPLPPIKWIDMKKELREGYTHPVSRPLLAALKETLQRGQQAILLMNRRGFHTYVLCKDCGERLECPHCSIALTYHRQQNSLVCHYCGYQQSLPKRCPHCGGSGLQYMGTGTERVVDDLKSQLPQARILRMDLDSTRQAGSHTEILKEFQDEKADILVGTQMVAKGFDFPKVTLAAVLHIDGVLNIPDYSSGEKAFQLMVQTAGRAGRGNEPGQVMIQTFFPENPVLKTVEAYDYEAFYNNEIGLREALGYPPFSKMARLLVSGPDIKIVQGLIDQLLAHCRRGLGREAEKIAWLGPVKAPVERIKNRWRYHVVLVSSDFALLRQCLVLARTFDIKEAVRSYNIADADNTYRLIMDMDPKSLL
jgi:primosomal protein N' (replication factor Y)